MNRDKQIEEMAKVIEQARIKAIDTTNSMNYGFGGWYAKELHNAGYRKASEVAEEIFAEIEKIIDIHYNRHIFGDEDLSDTEQEAVMNFSGDVTYDIAELKKKYAESEKDK